ncbi:restriction endonuclease subunit S [Sulfuriferula sp. GW1]|uniref:restriction endonuclease subunit S n=1 Tax=Sulfuriferula sp. GW1 TaxID=3345111 RepID=UPI0039AE9AF3
MTNVPGFNTVTIEEATERLIDYRGKTPPKTNSGVRLVTAKVVKGGQIHDEPAEYIAADFYDEWMRRGLPQKLDVLLTTEAPLGEVAILRDDVRIALAQRIILLRAKPGLLDPLYLFYALQSDFGQGELKARASGTTVLGIKQSELRKVRVPVFPLPVQQRIAGILSAYDELIENNQRRIRILEDMARSLYREWFVRFRYPGHESVPLVDSPLGQIPQGWECGRLDEVLVLQRGFDLPKDKREDGAVPIIAATGINGFHSVAKVKAPGVVTGRSGSIGTVLYVQEDFWPLNTALWVKEFPKSEPLFAYYLLSSLELKQFNSGAAVPTLNRNDVHGVQVVIPPRELQRRFQLNAGAMLKQAEILQRQTTNLRRTRDLLLPRLLSGQVNIIES